MTDARILIVGVGGDGPAGLSLDVSEHIAGADQLWGGERLLALWPDHPGEKVIIRANIAELVARLRQRGETRIVILASGDPGFYGIAGTLLCHFAPEEIEIVPHASSLQVAFARAGIAWSDAIFTSAHARPLAEVVGWAKRVPRLGILTDQQHTPAIIARTLLDAGVSDCRAIVAENLQMPDERLHDGRLRDLPKREFGPLNVLLLVQDDGWRPMPPYAPRPESAYEHRRGLITKADVRALSLARLALRATDTAWDIGAGSGAVSIEMADLAWRGRVYAVEHDAENLDYIRQNAARFGALNVEIIAGRAPDALAKLPSPDAVFIGGTGGAMEDILRHIDQVVTSGCRVVVNVATLENLHSARQTLRAFGWQPDVTQVSLAHGQDIAGNTRLAPLNPVFIVSGVKP
ncbi:MAG: precorrin-6y C5,15-methyltransferase (decarboxylating) subunit CbiE [Chloroflexi bacterium]|nr:precorrin-6y C5,15-methyltransferase (decarboxylating) subunit CbiE [Chloroflexota bacterium]